MQESAAIPGLLSGQTPKGGSPGSGPNVGACFQLALLAAAQGNDQEAGAYLRQVITALKALAGPGETNAGSSADS